ncbi:MAG: glycosyltransferase family 9 protein [Bdellovibrionales bacterium]|nr:glycosyltransferase family 9 protein [Bdellovibrionales bacterium]
MLVIGLGAMGAVLRATSLLPGIVKKYPGCHITWVTEKASVPLLLNNPLIDKVLPLEFDSVLKLKSFHFHTCFSLDKDFRIGGIINDLSIDEVFGFRVDPLSMSIVPATSHSEELWQIGLSDHKKFFENKKPETQLLFEAMALGEWEQSPYVLGFSSQELLQIKVKSRQWRKTSQQMVIGINTGCSPTISYKKLSVSGHRVLIQKIQARLPQVQIVLLGGPEDTTRNQAIAFGMDIIESPTTFGVRDGLTSVAACDLVVTGDSLGMHMAIALEKWTVAWFGPTCAHEIDLYDRGEKVISKATCGPCWKRSCEKDLMCYDQVNFDEIIESIERGLSCISLSSKPPFWEIFS